MLKENLLHFVLEKILVFALFPPWEIYLTILTDFFEMSCQPLVGMLYSLHPNVDFAFNYP